MHTNATIVIMLVAIASSTIGETQAEREPQPAVESPLTLAAAIQIALTNQPSLTAAGARVDAASGRARQAGRWPNPALEFVVEEWPVSGGGSFSDSKQTIGVAQELPWPGKKKLDRRIGESGIRVSEAEMNLRRAEVVRDVKAAFFSVLAAERSVEVGEELLRLAESSADTARRRVEAGATAYQEQLRSEIQLEQARAGVENLRLAAVSARETLFTFLNRPDLHDAPLQGDLTGRTEPPTESDLASWIPRHPSMVAAQSRLDRARLASRRAGLEPYPDVTAAVSGGRLGESDENIIQFGVSIPIPLLDASKGRKAEARARVAEAEADMEAIRRALERAWTVALKRYRTAAGQAANYRERIVPKANEALRLVQTGFEEGKFNFIDLLDTQRTTAEVQLAYQLKLRDLNVAQAEVEALVQPASSTTSTLNR